MMCTIYSVLFVYAFAALGNLGLIARERTLLFPFFLVLLCIPRTPKGPPGRPTRGSSGARRGNSNGSGRPPRSGRASPATGDR